MADKRIDQLTAATSLTAVDLMVTEQSGVAKKVTGDILANSAWNMMQKDATPTEDSTAPITSGAVYDAMGGVFSPTKVATPGALVHFEDGAYKKPLEALRLAINPVQSGTGDPSPDNVRPITGWTGANVNVVGKNLLDKNAASYTDGGVTHVITDDSITVTSATDTNVWKQIRTNLPKCSVDTTYIISCEGMEKSDLSFVPRLLVMNEHNNTIGALDNIASYAKLIFTIPANKQYSLIFRMSQTGNPASGTYVKFMQPMVRFAFEEDPTYEPSKKHIYPISFGSAGTVYGGTLDVVSGELIVDKAIIDIGPQNWSSTSNFFYLSFATAQPSATDNIKGDIICECYNNVARNSLLNYDYAITINSRAVVSVRDVRYTDLASFKSALAGKHFVYKLATPITYQLTPVEVFTLLGENNIWADTGDIEELAYRADIGLYLVDALNPIKELIANREDTMRATKNYVTGDYIIVGNTLYKALTSIANGTSLTVNGNVRITTVGAELKTALQN